MLLICCSRRRRLLLGNFGPLAWFGADGNLTGVIVCKPGPDVLEERCLGGPSSERYYTLRALPRTLPESRSRTRGKILLQLGQEPLKACNSDPEAEFQISMPVRLHSC